MPYGHLALGLPICNNNNVTLARLPAAERGAAADSSDAAWKLRRMYCLHEKIEDSINIKQTHVTAAIGCAVYLINFLFD